MKRAGKFFTLNVHLKSETKNGRVFIGSSCPVLHNVFPIIFIGVALWIIACLIAMIITYSYFIYESLDEHRE